MVFTKKLLNKWQRYNSIILKRLLIIELIDQNDIFNRNAFEINWFFIINMGPMINFIFQEGDLGIIHI